MITTWNADKTVSINPPTKPKKITGTRLASILGYNSWNTPFKTWCEMTKTYEEPYEDTKYTLAGKTIEPIQHEYMRKNYGMKYLQTPEDAFGKDYFKRMHGDFYHNNPIFGGMWDALLLNEDGTIDAVLEFKTTSRVEDWKDSVPPYYALQGALYAYLYGVDHVIMVCSFLEDKDYLNPSAFEPNVSNTIVVPFSIKESLPDFEDYIKRATDFYKYNVLKGVSPVITDKDATLVKVLRSTTISNDSEIETLLAEAETLQAEVDAVEQTLDDKNKRLKDLKDTIKERFLADLDDNHDTISHQGNKYTFTLKKSVRSEINKALLKTDGLLEKYLVEKESYTLTVKENKEK